MQASHCRGSTPLYASYMLSDELVYVQHLCVNGSVGAFLRPTHVFGNFKNVYNTSYEMAVAYPSCEDSSRMSTIGKSSDILWHECSVKKANMEELLKLKGCLIWITGLSGSVIWTPYPGRHDPTRIRVWNPARTQHFGLGYGIRPGHSTLASDTARLLAAPTCLLPPELWIRHAPLQYVRTC